MTEPIEIRNAAVPDQRPDKQRHRKTKGDTERRFQELLDRVKRLREDLACRDREIAQARSERDEREARQKEMPALITHAREKGRKLFHDFDAVVTGVQINQPTFEALLLSPNGPELMYAMGLGLRLIAAVAQKQREAQRIEYYREMHRQHFQGAS